MSFSKIYHSKWKHLLLFVTKPTTLYAITFVLFWVSVVILVNVVSGRYMDGSSYPTDVDIYEIQRQLENQQHHSHINLNIPPPINDHRFETIFSPIDVCGNSNWVDVLFVVKSTVNEFELRNAIRTSWGNPRCVKHTGNTTRLLFMLGKPNTPDWISSDIQKQVQNEFNLYKDIVQFDFVESYHNVTLKLIASLDFILEYCPHVKYLALIDEDFLVHPLNVIKALTKVNRQNYSTYIAGEVLPFGRPVRFYYSKWYISYSDYAFAYYPPFATGGTILLSTKLAKVIAVGLKYIKLLPFEDVMIGLILFKLKVQPIHLDTIYALHAFDGRVNDVISLHGFRNPQNMLDGWKRFGFEHICNTSN